MSLTSVYWHPTSARSDCLTWNSENLLIDLVGGSFLGGAGLVFTSVNLKFYICVECKRPASREVSKSSRLTYKICFFLAAAFVFLGVEIEYFLKRLFQLSPHDFV